MKTVRLLLFLIAAAPLAFGPLPKDDVWSREIDGYPVHIYSDPNGEKDTSKRGVLILGTFSDAQESIRDARKLVNPSTGRPYDVIIGVGWVHSPQSKLGFLGELKENLKEGSRVVLEDHWTADKNAEAVKKGIELRFGAPLAAAYVDAHSNGTPVGITAIEKGALREVKQVHLMGPDIGFAGKYVAEDRLNKMKDLGIQEVHVHRTKGDIIHGLGNLTEGIAQGAQPLTATLAEKFRDLVVQSTRLSAAGGKPDSIIRNHEYEMAATPDSPVDAHFVIRYIALRANDSRDPVLIQKTRHLMGSPEYDHAAGTPIDPTARSAHLHNGRPIEEVVRSNTPEENKRLLKEFKEKAEKARTLREEADYLFLCAYVRSHLLHHPASDSAKGVRIHFDERILADVLERGTPEENARMLNDLGRRLAEARTLQERAEILSAFETTVKLNFRKLGKRHRLNDLSAVSLKSLVTRAESYAGRWNELPAELRHPGGLTRLHGYVIAGDDILVVGRREKDAPPLDIDDLTIGLRAAWKENITPLVSLDPDPENIEGDPHSRIQGIPGNSGFALTMLEADYAMKKIMGGIPPMDVAGYRTLKEILRDNRQNFISRFWLYPIQPGPGDIQMSSDASSAVFTGGVHVLSEEMKQIKEGLVGTGKTFGPAEEAARSFSAHYEAIAAKEPLFRKLQGLFDVVLLGRIWRHCEVKSPLLDRLCALPYRSVDIPRTYKAVPVLVHREGDMEYYLFGGVQVKIGAGRKSWLALDDDGLKTLHERARTASSSGAVSTALTDVGLDSAVPSTRPDSSSRDYSAVVVALVQGKLDVSLEAADRLTKSDPWDTEAFVLRALIHLRRADYPCARRDALRARELDPDSQEIDAAATEILFQCRWMEGDPEGALREIEWTLRRDANSSYSHVARGDALSKLKRPDEARKEYEKAVELDPASAIACARLATLELAAGRTLAAKPWIKKAEALEPGRAEVRIALAWWELATIRPDNAEKIAAELWEKDSVSPTIRLQALAVLASVSASREQWDRVDDCVTKMDRLRAGSPEVLVAAAEIAFTWGERERARRYTEKAERLAPKHPMVIELRKKVGK